MGVHQSLRSGRLAAIIGLIFVAAPLGAQTVTATVPVGLNPIAVAVNPATNKVYVANFGGTKGITVIDRSKSPTTTTTLATITGQTAVAVNPLTNRIYFVDSYNYLTVVDGSTDTVMGNAVMVGGDPVAVAVNPATNTIYVANVTGSSVSVINGVDNSVTATLHLTGGPNLLQGFLPASLYVNPVTNKIYVTCQSATMVIDGANISSPNAVTQLAYTGGLVGGGPVGVNPVTNTLYAVEGGNSTVLVIDEATNTTTTLTSPFGAPFDVALNPVSNTVYVLNTLGDVTVIDGMTYSTSQVTDANAKTPSAVTVNPTTNQVYVTNAKSNNVTVINGGTYAATLAVGTNPVAIAENPVTGEVFVANYTSNDVTVIAGTGTVQPIPLATTITSFPGNQSSTSTPTFNFSAVSTFASFAPTVEAVYFQVDSQQGPWIQAASTGGANFSGTVTAPLTGGTHTVYAFATDGQDATSTITGAQSSPLVGSIASYQFSVAASGPALSPSPNPLAFGNQTQGTTSSAMMLTVTNTGTTDLSITNVTPGGTNMADFPIASDTCANSTVAAGKTCTVSVAFAPSTTSGESATLIFADNASNSPQTVMLTGTGVAPVPTPTTTALSASATSVAVGASVTLPATVTPASGTPTPTGTVTFKDGAATLGTGTLNASGVATYAAASLAVGSHSITATYAGDTRNTASTSGAVAVAVTVGATTTTLTASPTSLAVGSSVTFTATVTGTAGVPAPTGAVTFMNGTTTLGTGTLNGSGTATYSTSSLAVGSYSVTAVYGGDANNSASTSPAVTVAVWAGASDFSLALSSSSGSVSRGKPMSVTVTVTSINGFAGATTLSCSGLPKNTTCAFSPSSVTPAVSGNATSSMTITADTNATTAALDPLGNGAAPHLGRVAFGVVGALFLLPIVGSKRRKLLQSLGALLLLVILVSGVMTGCGGGGPTTPTGTYSVQVNAASGSSSHNATFSLTVQ